MVCQFQVIKTVVKTRDFKKNEEFPEKIPPKPNPKAKREYPDQPRKEEPVFTFIEKIFKAKKEQKIREYENRYTSSMVTWENQKFEIDNYNRTLEQEFETEVQIWQENVVQWEERKKIYLKEQDEYNKKIDEMKEAYFNLNEDSVVEYCEMVLENSVYPESFPKSFELEYSSETKILIVEYQLPSIECFPTLKEVKYLTSKKELKETHLTENQVTKMFDGAMYKIALRTMHELFEADRAKAIEAVSFNGWVNAINKATGKEENNCILKRNLRAVAGKLK